MVPRSGPRNIHLRDMSSGTAATSIMTKQDTARRRTQQRKTRLGCYNCKRRHIKCQESRPECTNCVKAELNCEYPQIAQLLLQPNHETYIFSLQDMRFWQHYLLQCFPLHPLKQEDIWTHEIACFAHSHDFLMHSILGFAASDISHGDNSVTSLAMTHRIKAIRSLKRRLMNATRTSTTYEEANALLAASFVLAFQSLYIRDGLADYLTFIRGILVISLQIFLNDMTPIFTTLMEEAKIEAVGPAMTGLSLLEKPRVDAAVAAISSLRPLCLRPWQHDYCDTLLNTAMTLYLDSFEAYQASSNTYTWWMTLPQESFNELIDFTDQATILLHSHWLSLIELMTCITKHENVVREKQPAATDLVRPQFTAWLKHLESLVDHEHRVYNEWPSWVIGQLDMSTTFFSDQM